MNLAKYQKEDTVTATITANAQGNLAVDADNGLYYVAQVEIPGYEYEDVEVEGPAENDTMTAAAAEDTDVQAEDTAPLPTSSARQSRSTPKRSRCACGASKTLKASCKED